MSENDALNISAKVNKLLAPLTQEDREAVLRAAAALYGCGNFAVTPATPPQTGDGDGATPEKGVSNQDFFGQKCPNTVSERLAVAARYRELHMGQTTHSRKEIENFFASAHESFDGPHYGRDMGNARKQGFFVRGNPRDVARLTTYGQKFVDALPDRDATSRLVAPKGSKRSKRKKKKGQK